MMKSLILLNGWWKLKFGFCPMCDSSPPQPSCVVCYGDRKYGHLASARKRQDWWERFKEFYR